MSGWCGPLENQVKGGVVATKHGMSNTPTYRSWAGMVQRCSNSDLAGWGNYGGRGITVCERWLKFENFLADMGERPKGTSIDRYPNNDGNYEPGNARWANRSEQNENTRAVRYITFNGESLSLSGWSRRLGIGVGTLGNRLDRGWSLERAFTKDSSDRRNSKNKSGFANVYQAGDKWISQIVVNGKRINLGKCDTPEAAHELQIEASKKYGIDFK